MLKRPVYILPDRRKATDRDRLHPLIAMKLERLEKKGPVFIAETDKGEKVIGRLRN